MTTVCLADSDAKCRALWRDAARSVGDCSVVAECDQGYDALRVIRELHPAVVVAETRLPRVDGFALLLEANATSRITVVLTTTEPLDAIRAFTEGAVDCVLKPLEVDRCRAGLFRARQHVARADALEMSAQLANMLQNCDARPEHASREPYLRQVVISSGRRSIALPVTAIDWIRAEGCYSRVYTDSVSYLTRRTLAVFEQRLNPMTFVRPNRSAVVNIDRVSEFDQRTAGGPALVLKSGVRIPVSQRRRGHIATRFATG